VKRRMSARLCATDRAYLAVGLIASVATVIFYMVNGYV